MTTEARRATLAGGRMRRNRVADDETWLGRLMLAPAVVYIVALVGFPFVLALFYSVSDVTVGSTGLRFIGLENFRQALDNPTFLRALRNTFIFAVTDMIVIYVLTRGGPYDQTQVLATLAFFTGIDGGDLAGGAAIALFLFPVLAATAVALLRLARRSEVV